MSSQTATLLPPKSLFLDIPPAPADPILGLVQEFKESKHPQKQNLGPGVYMDGSGKTLMLSSVLKALATYSNQTKTDTYLPLDGNERFISAARTLAFGEGCSAVKEGRVVGVQVPGGTAAVALGAHLMRRYFPDKAPALISDPTWPNHRGVLGGANFQVREYPYYQPETRRVDFDRLMTSFEALSKPSLVVLHAGCHNPTGCDFSAAQWQVLADFFANSPHLALLDAAYLGFKDGLQSDRAPLELFVSKGVPFLAAVSFSKNFSLYSFRVGAMFAVCDTPLEASNLLSQAKATVRTLWSSPPSTGGALVETVLHSPELRAEWEKELTGMRERIKAMRSGLVDALKQRGLDFAHLLEQHGMFSFTGLTATQVAELKTQFGIFMTSNGRLAVPALNAGNLEIVADAIAAVIKPQGGKH